jgi:hypothetical protein
MRVKTSELKDLALDWAVTKCEGFNHKVTSSEWGMWGWSTDWAQGGPIIEREQIGVSWTLLQRWVAEKCNALTPEEMCASEGDTPLIAAMRCYVASQLGDEVEVPEELT